jgi:hypothetical protein
MPGYERLGARLVLRLNHAHTAKAVMNSSPRTRNVSATRMEALKSRRKCSDRNCRLPASAPASGRGGAGSALRYM